MRWSFSLVVSCAFCLVIFGQTPGALSSPVEVNYAGSAIEWAPLLPAKSCLLTITGPDRFYLRQAYPEGARPVFGSLDDQGLARPDGSYRWKLVVELTMTEPDGTANRTVSGAFAIRAGIIAPLSSSEIFDAPVGALSTETGGNNFFGWGAGASITVGNNNSFFGADAGYRTTSGGQNSFFGESAGYNNTTGADNCFFGRYSGRSNTSGRLNTFLGSWAGYGNTTGEYNTFVGNAVGYYSTVERFNTLVGYGARFDPGANPATDPIERTTAIGSHAYVSQSNSVVLGSIGGVNGATEYANVGIGTSAPARQLHLAGPNAVFRMDRSTDTAAFLLVRTNSLGIPWKTFVVGTNATGYNQGEFIINDIGTAVGGAGNRRMTITNEGDVTFNGNVYAASFTPTSSAAFKTNIRTFENALEAVSRLRGVRFDWKDSGKPAVGLIAEEVNEVLPEVVAQENGKARGVIYDNLVAVLVEAVKEQQKTIRDQQKANEEQRAAFDKEVNRLNQKLARLEALLEAK